MNDELEALQASVARLRRVVSGLSPDQLRRSAYPTEWTIADVLSHLGSGAVIMERRLVDALAGAPTPTDFAQSVWDEWNAKSPDAQAADSLAIDQALVDRVRSFSNDERARVQVSFGPITVDLRQALGLRLNEHALHAWDVEVALDPNATLLPTSTAIVIDNLEMIVRFAGKPSDSRGAFRVHTDDPVRDLLLTLGDQGVSLETAAADGAAQLELSAEAFVRLVYGRLDAEHAPPVAAHDVLDTLRAAFPGV